VADRFDPARAKPETLHRLARAVDAWYGHDSTEEQPGWCEDSKEMLRAVVQLRAECRVPLRTRAEVDAEIADWIRSAVESKLHINPTWERVEQLCAEPTAEAPCS